MFARYVQGNRSRYPRQEKNFGKVKIIKYSKGHLTFKD